MKIRAQTLSHIMDGVIFRGNPEVLVGHFSIDTRTIKPGEWFIAFKGKNADGHLFIPDAIAKGAGGIICNDALSVPAEPRNLPVISIGDPIKALNSFTRYIRVSTALFPWYAITGSVGKTTAKGFLAEILKCEGATPLVTPGNWNTDIGVPLTLSGFLNDKYDAVVLEFAMRARGEIAYLAEMTQPHIGLITNIAPCHLETLGTMEEIADAKAELLQHLDKRSAAVLNLDDPFYERIKSKYSGEIITFSHLGSDATVQAFEWDWDNDKNITFKLSLRGGKPESVKLKTPSMGMAQSAIAASAGAVAGKVPDQFIFEGLSKYAGEELRMSIFVTDSGIKVILDCYNANPKSMVDSLQVLGLYKKEGRTIAVLGGMLELGNESRAWHRQVADYATSEKIDIIISVGKEGRFYYERFTEIGMENVFHFMTNQEVIDWLNSNAHAPDTVLIKGSRGFKLEEVGKGDW